MNQQRRHTQGAPDRQQRLAVTRATLAGPAPADGPLQFTASTERMNRYGYSLRHEGWRLEDYAANPVLLWMHNPYTPPVGKADASLDKMSRTLQAAVTFDTGDELGAALDRKYRGGFLSALSVSWDFLEEDGTPVLNWWRLDQEEMDELFFDLCEISAVSVPGDPGAVRQQRLALAALLGPGVADLYAQQEHPEPGVTADMVRAEVAAQLLSLGLIVPGASGAGTTPASTSTPAKGIDATAAQAVLAAFTVLEDSNA